MAAQRFVTSDFLKIHTNMTAVTSQCNIMKLSQMKLKLRITRAILRKKPNETCPTQCLSQFTYNTGVIIIITL